VEIVSTPLFTMKGKGVIMKLDISVSRKATINTGNYSSIGPGVSVTAHDVNQLGFQEAYETISNLADALFALETLKLSEEMGTIKEQGLPEYSKMLSRSKDVMVKQVEEYEMTGKVK